jgi:hypothetical protein
VAIDHVPPLRDSISASFVVELVESPTAVQYEVVGHETADNMLLVAPNVFGLGTTDHEAPFHDSTSVWSIEVPADCPTAVQLVPSAAAGHEIPLRVLDGLPAGFGLGTTDHPNDDAEAGPADRSAVTNVVTTATRATRATRTGRLRIPIDHSPSWFPPIQPSPRPLP